MDKGNNKKFKWQAFISVLATVFFALMAFTGIILFLTPPGRVANWTGWTLIALTKHQWGGLHIWFGLLFIITSAFHLYFNWKPLVSYFKDKVSRSFAMRAEWIVALIIPAIVFVGTLAEIKPFSSLLALNEAIKHSWETPNKRAPIPHAESLSLASVSEYIQDVNLETMVANLKAKGIEVSLDDVGVVFGDLAEASGMTPNQLFEIAVGQSGYYSSSVAFCSSEQDAGRAGSGAGGESQSGGQKSKADSHSKGGGSGSGFGRMTLRQFCAQLDLEINASVKMLNNLGFVATPDMTVRAIADSAGAHPSEVRLALDPEGHDH